MSNVRRVYVEKKPSFAVKAKELKHEISSYLGIKTVTNVRELIRYDVENISDDTRIVKVALQTGIELPYYPQALKPVLTRETVSRMDAAFSMRTESLVKRNMKTRVLLDQDFIQDIGTIEI